ncbi:hypothetical protein [uncultured Nocardioides sp.]|uniref:hypothetical protein n=1 Tax=uncultured Nocardioides sp. TaxID=198441 RepID=UPI002607EA62|nr:hypothetical protein [uncultured Nocardioides sp.]
MLPAIDEQRFPVRQIAAGEEDRRLRDVRMRDGATSVVFAPAPPSDGPSDGSSDGADDGSSEVLP